METQPPTSRLTLSHRPLDISPRLGEYGEIKLESTCYWLQPMEPRVRGPVPPPVVDEESRRMQKHKRKPVVIYTVSPEVIHAEASEFMALVQRLTGPGSSRPPGEAPARAPPSPKVRDQQLPVRVKARALNGSGSGGAASAPDAPSPSVAASDTLFFHGSSPPSCAVRKDEAPMASQSWLLHGEYLDQSPRHQP
ncbi:hypothetical protein OPV22_012807 [Ensete ventricosum]|uniref:VQ domain-containing protein n=1 Tax=Ensete ventricosum TaxID=4639 RepID=A0AAV8R8C1_ENSVE|nr:hypothetical protein OPV22_012807 [Ensete ventricosum]RZS20563.1 hypothetical protein BHM03_00053092 [Ensete ventricosum]